MSPLRSLRRDASPSSPSKTSPSFTSVSSCLFSRPSYSPHASAKAPPHSSSPSLALDSGPRRSVSGTVSASCSSVFLSIPRRRPGGLTGGRAVGLVGSPCESFHGARVDDPWQPRCPLGLDSPVALAVRHLEPGLAGHVASCRPGEGIAPYCCSAFHRLVVNEKGATVENAALTMKADTNHISAQHRQYETMKPPSCLETNHHSHSIEQTKSMAWLCLASVWTCSAYEDPKVHHVAT